MFTSSVADFTSHLVAKKEDQDALDKFYGGNIKSTDEITCSYNSLRLHLNKVEGKEIVDTLGELYEFVAKDEIDSRSKMLPKKRVNLFI